MEHIGIGSAKRQHQQPGRQLIGRLALVMTLVVACTLLEGRDSDAGDGGNTTVITFVGTPNTEVVIGLPFGFTDGAVFHSGLADRMVTLTLDTVTNTMVDVVTVPTPGTVTVPVITVTLATEENQAQGEVVLDDCDFSDPFAFFRDPFCLYDIMVTASDFPVGTGPQIGEVIALRDWLLIARVERPANRVTVRLVVEDATGILVPSELLEVDRLQLCPWVCPGP